MHLDGQRPHRRVGAQDGPRRVVLGEQGEAPPLVGPPAVDVERQQHRHDDVVERQDAQRPVDGVVAQAELAPPVDQPADEGPEEQVAGEDEEEVHAVGAGLEGMRDDP